MRRLVTMLTRHRMALVAALAMSATGWGAVVAQDDPFGSQTNTEKEAEADKPPPPPAPEKLAPEKLTPENPTAEKEARAAEATEVDVPAADKENAETPEVLARGPIHEAFAEAVVFDPKPGLIVHKKPPADVPELPPEQKPDEPDMVWIPGYWAWDDDRDDFLWVTGIWRRIPQGRQWMAGYWAELPDDSSGEGDRYQWVAGRWAATDEEEVEYLPPPPPTLEEGPNVPAPADDYVWQPGVWTWGGTQYNWRGGFWAAGNPNWMWVPPYYCWTPRGYLYNSGYWDYGLNRRGICYAPVYFNSPFYLNRGYYYSPLAAFNMGLFNRHLFLRPGYNHYYFGDYYASRYQQGGIYPWFAYHNRRYGYDPFYASARVQFGGRDPNWNRQLMADFQRRRDNTAERPPHTFAQMKQQMAAGKGPGDRDGNANMLLASLDTMAKNAPDSLKLTTLNNQQRRDLMRDSEQWNQWRSERRAAETAADARDRAAARQRAADVAGKGAGKGKSPDASALRPDRAKLPKSPFASNFQQGRRNDRPGDGRTGEGRIQLNKLAVPDDGGKGKTGDRPNTQIDRPNVERPNSGRAESKTPAPKGADAAPRFQGPQGSGGPGGREPKTPPPKGGGSQPRFQGPQGGGGPGGREPQTPAPKGPTNPGGPSGGSPRPPGAGGGGGQRPPTPRLNIPSGPSVTPRTTPAPSVAPRAPSTPSIPRGPTAAPRIGGGGGGGAPRMAPAPSGPRGGGGGGGAPRGGGGGPRGGGDGPGRGR